MVKANVNPMNGLVAAILGQTRHHQQPKPPQVHQVDESRRLLVDNIEQPGRFRISKQIREHIRSVDPGFLSGLSFGRLLSNGSILLEGNTPESIQGVLDGWPEFLFGKQDRHRLMHRRKNPTNYRIVVNGIESDDYEAKVVEFDIEIEFPGCSVFADLKPIRYTRYRSVRVDLKD